MARRPARPRTSLAGVWGRVGLALVLAIALAKWPYARACDWSLFLYLAAVAILAAAGLWGALFSWKTRLGLAHVVALLTILWAFALAAHEVLPRAADAKTPGAHAVWRCARP